MANFCMKRSFLQNGEGVLYISYVRPTIWYEGGEARCLKREIIILQTDKFMLAAMCGIWLNDRRAEDLMLMFGLDDTMSAGYGKQCALAWSLFAEDGHCLQRMVMS